MMTPKRLLPALALFVLPSIGCVGAAPVDEPAPPAAVHSAAAPAQAATGPAQGFPHGSGTTADHVGSTGGAEENMLGGCTGTGGQGDGIGGDDGNPCPPPGKPPVQAF